MTFDRVQAIADAVLYEGYVLYPYRASAAKNQIRWQFGVLAPQAPGGQGEPWFSRTDCLIEPGASPRVSVRIRGLRPAWREGGGEGGGDAAPAPWLDGVPCSVDVAPIDLVDLPLASHTYLEIRGVPLRLTAEARPAGPYVALRLHLENLEPWRPAFDGSRDEILCRSLVAAHLLLAVEDGAFVSLLEPPPEAAEAVAACANRHTWPVLVGERGERSLLLSSPIILYDYPAVAPESHSDLCDGTEIDEILSLRILTLTDEEKREARATDPRARAIVDRVEGFGADDFARLHGTMRDADFFNPAGVPPPHEDAVVVRGVRVARGSAVRLRPNRRADAMDMFLRGQQATVAGVYRDVDDRVHVAVTVDADPGADLHESFGRFFYFDPEEIEPIAPVAESTPAEPAPDSGARHPIDPRGERT